MRVARRGGLLAAALLLAFGTRTWAAAPPSAVDAQKRLAALEAAAGGRLGVAALDTGDGDHVRYRADERFPLCSTFKVMLVGAVLKRSETDRGLLDRRIAYTERNLVTHSPITEQHVGKGMTVAQLGAAALQHSDNTAANLLVARLGGPSHVTAFARSIDDLQFRLDRWEPTLNTAIPGDPRDTTTPAAMAESLARLTLADGLGAPARGKLVVWLRGNTTGAARIRAGVPAAWKVGDKTGTGDYGTTNDIAVLWPPAASPIVLAVYFTQPRKDAPARSDVVASAARIVAEALSEPAVSPAAP